MTSKRAVEAWFSKNCTFSDVCYDVIQNATIGTVVTRFNATDEDLDKNGEVGYQIVSGNTDGMFGINNHTGEFFTSKDLDYEKIKAYEVCYFFIKL